MAILVFGVLATTIVALMVVFTRRGKAVQRRAGNGGDTAATVGSGTSFGDSFFVGGGD